MCISIQKATFRGGDCTPKKKKKKPAKSEILKKRFKKPVTACQGRQTAQPNRAGHISQPGMKENPSVLKEDKKLHGHTSTHEGMIF